MQTARTGQRLQQGSQKHSLAAALAPRHQGGQNTRPGVVKAAVQTGSADAIKQRLFSKAGKKNGLDRSPEQQQELSGIVSELASTSSSHKLDLAGSHWTLRYTDSTTSSAGKLGPLTGYVEQEFPQDKPNRYYNKVDFGLLKAKLEAEYFRARDDKINVNFVNFTFFLGPFKFSKDFQGSGHWILRYTDPNVRVLDSNQNHVFVLERISGPKINI